jgi:hypothetical protein
VAVDAARRFPGISADAHGRLGDRAATSAPSANPLTDRLPDRLSGLGLERPHRHVLVANAVRVGSPRSCASPAPAKAATPDRR